MHRFCAELALAERHQLLFEPSLTVPPLIADIEFAALVHQPNYFGYDQFRSVCASPPAASLRGGSFEGGVQIILIEEQFTERVRTPSSK